jgi:hypothetical protein
MTYSCYIILRCIPFPGFKVNHNDCRIWNVSYKYKNLLTVQLKFSHKKTQENKVVTHKDIQKYIHICTGVGQNNGNTTGTIHISLLILCRTTFCLQYSHSPFLNGLVQVLISLYQNFMVFFLKNIFKLL